jgi:hypothetical protein
MLSLVPYIIPRNLCKKSPDAAKTSFTMTVVWYLYISCVHDSTLLWNLFDALITSHNVLSVCARTVISRSCDFHPSHLVILMFHIPIIISIQAPCQSIDPFTRNPPIYSYWFSPIIPSIISSSFYTSSLPWFYFQNLEGKLRNIWENISCPIDPSPTKVRSNFHSNSSFEFNEVNWLQICWTKYSFENSNLAMGFKKVLGLKSLIWIWTL